MGSLQDALLNTGLASEEQARKKPRKPQAKGGKPGGNKGPKKARGGKGAPGPRTSRKPGGPLKERKPQSDLERAYAARMRAEKAEKEREKQARVADQEARRKRNLELDKLVEGKALNVPEAELPRYFEHIGRIRRVLCTPEQREKINAGELGVVSLRGGYLIVEPEVLEAYKAIAPDLVPDLAGKEPDAPEDDDYPPVPDDVTW
ncbi:DUF2058 family protein [Halomonas denitrificans]|nr:DUF2058 family protein [Halomonas denitrificans]